MMRYCHSTYAFIHYIPACRLSSLYYIGAQPTEISNIYKKEV